MDVNEHFLRHHVLFGDRGVYKINFKEQLVKQYMDVNEDERLSNNTHRHVNKSKRTALLLQYFII